MTTYGIDSFHISVGAGDAAIHVLIAIPPMGSPTFDRAILIDGGDDQMAVTSIIMTMRQIEIKYGMVVGSLKFDTIIITHWDTDHFGGIVRMISGDIKDQETRTPGTKVTQISFMKYNGPTPATVLYVPGWEKGEDKGVGKRNRGTPALEFGINKPPQVPGQPEVEFLDFNRAPKVRPAVLTTKICVLRQDNLLGVNFLTNAVVDPKTPFHGTPKELVALNRPGTPGMPGIYCVAACLKVLERVKSTKMEIEKKVPKNIDPNPHSICAMVIWDDGRISHYFGGDVDSPREARIALWTGDQKVLSMKLSHHGALTSTPPALLNAFMPNNIIISSGNIHGHPRCELMLYISAWLRGNQRTDRPVYTTEYPFYLAGSSGGTFRVPGKLTPQFRIKVVPVKPNRTLKPAKDEDGDGEELISALAKIFNMYPKMENLLEEFEDLTMQKVPVLKTAEAGSKKVKIEGKDLEKQDKTATKKVEKVMGDVQEENVTKSDAMKVKEFSVLFRMVELYWGTMSYIDRCCHRLSASGFCGGSAQKVRGPVEYIRVACRSTAITDGVVFVRYKDSADDEPPREVPVPKAAIQLDASQLIANLAYAIDFTLPSSNESSAMPIAPLLMSAPSTDPRRSILTILPDSRTTRSVVEPAMEAASEGSDEDPDPDPELELPEVPEVLEVKEPEPSPRSVKVRLMSLITNDFVGEPHTEVAREHEEEEDQPAAQPAARSFNQSRGDSGADSFYFYCSGVKGDDSSYNATLPASDMDDFVTLLHYGVLSLEKKPTEDVPAKFLETDEWFSWLIDAINATSLSATVNKLGNLTGFKLSMTPPAKSTSSADILFTTGKSTTEISGPLGEVDMMVFGLEHSETLVTMTLAEAVAYVGLPKLAAATTVGKLGDMTLTLHEGGRNAIWFDPRNLYKTVVRLQFQPDLVKANKFFTEFLTDFKVNDAAVIAKTSSLQLTGPAGVSVVSDAEVILSANCTVAMTGRTPVNFGTALTFHQNSMKLELSTATKDVFTDMMVWLARLAHLPDIAGWLKDVGLPQLRRTSMTIELDGIVPKVVHFNIEMEVKMEFGGESAVSLVTYSWVKGGGIGALKGELWCKPPAFAILPFRKSLPDWEEHLVLEPITVAEPRESFDLANIIPQKPGGVIEIPKAIPHEICQASIEVDNAGVRFFGLIACTKPSDTDIPVSLEKLKLDASYRWDTKNFKMAFSVRGSIRGREDSEFNSTAVMLGSVEYSDGIWELNASLRDLHASTLYSFFDSDSREDVMIFLDRIEIKYLSLYYNFSKTAKHFEFRGILLLGNLELDLKFDSDDDGWVFSASLGTSNTRKSTIGEIVESIIGSSDDIPSFVKSIEVGGSDPDLISVKCEKVEGGLFFAVSIHINFLRFTFVQYRSAALKSTKRAIKVSVQELPSVEVPILGNIMRPFDEMFYMWVQDTAGQASPKGAGLTRAEVTSINSKLLLEKSLDALLFKETVKTKKLDDVVIAAGSHFVLVLKDENGTRNVVLDHLFQASSKPKEPSSETVGDVTPSSETVGDETPSSALTTIPSSAVDTEPSAKSAAPVGDSSGASMAPYKKSIGPLSISNIGFQYKDGALIVLFDATFLLGPVSFTLIGFSLGIQFGGEFNLQNLPHITPSINGLSVSFNRPPLLIAGLFEHAVKGNLDYYAGGIVVTFDPYLFKAAGFYGKTSGDDPYESILVFGKLEGPLVTLGYAEISGITGGFGYNLDIRFPRVDQVRLFPFLASDKLSSDPMATLSTLTGGEWFTPKKGSFWVAAGLKVTAFQTLTIDAVIVVQWNPEIALGIFGIVSADMPKRSAAASRFAHVELQISATIDFRVGVTKIEGQLSPSSFILSPSCHLTGGFALYCWFEGSKHEGDWVFTIGGFHPAFKRPEHYPNPPRLGISWSLDSSLSITGEAYFAITPKVCMGGGRLHAALSLGALDAWFDAYADFLINYNPFHFIANVGVSVGVRFTMDVWFVSIHISVEIGAQLHLVGPPVSGTLHVDFWVFGFDINFGPPPAKAEPANLPEFYKLVLQSGPPIAGGKDTTDPQPHLFGCQSGLIPGQQKTSSDEIWNVRAGSFSFLISCRFPISSATLNANTVKENAEIYAKPMRLVKPATSTMGIVITTDGDPAEWKMTEVVKPVPNALWGIYNSSEDPMENPGSLALLESTGVSTHLMMGVLITAPDAVLSDDVILKFNVAKAVPQNAFPPGAAEPFPEVIASSTNWLPLKPDPNKDQWNAVRDAWRVDVGQKKSMDAWKGAFGWEDQLLGFGPKLLLDNFDEFYMAAPLLCRKKERVAVMPILV